MTAALLPPPVHVETPDRRPPADGPPRGRGRRLVQGPVGDPGWARPALLSLLILTGVLYLWDLGASGTANEFYAAAVQAGTQSWKAMFFGSLDAGNAITVDKPAFFLWPMEITGRLFGFNAWSMLAPQALEGIAAVALLTATICRATGSHTTGLLAGATLALTPVAVLMFKFNNPDAMLALLLTTAGYTLIRALQTTRGQWWLALTGTLIGLGFITKMGQALLIVPALSLTYLLCAPTTLRHRITDLLGAGLAMTTAAGWYILTVELWPTTNRPYIGGSTTNSLLELALGYNGLGRLLGGSGNTGGGTAGGGGGGGQSTAFGGNTGLTRLLTGDFATEISWLLPTALLALLTGLWLTRHAPRTDLHRATLILSGTTLLTTALTFSYMQGTIHPYYTIALATPITATTTLTAHLLWQTRTQLSTRLTAAALVVVTAGWSVHLLALTPTFVPALRYLLVLAAAVAVAGLLFGSALRKGLVVAVAVALLAGLGGSAAYALDTASQAHSGSIPSSGPVASAMGAGATGAGATGGAGRTGGAATGGGAAGSTSSDTALTTLLQASTTRWAAATTGAQSAAQLELSSGTSVIGIGGFGGSDPAPTLAQFEAYVAAGDIHYFIAGSSGGGGGASGTGSASQITAWVTAHYTATTVGGSTVYDLTAAATS